MNLINFIVFVTLFVLCKCATDQTHNKPIAYNDVHDKYCELQTKTCNYTLHPLCAKFNPLHYRIENYKFIELSQNEIEFILRTLNTFRNDLAAGKIAEQKSGSNLRVVKWSDDYVRLLRAKLMYREVCTEISFTSQIILEMVEFSDTDSVDDDDTDSKYFYRSMFLARVWNDSISNSPWFDIFRAEFNSIGCVYYEDNDYDTKMFTCYVNRYGPRDREIEMSTLYRYGVPCSNCDGKCSTVWSSLCDESAENPPVAWNYEHHKIMILIVLCGCVLLLAVIAMRIIVQRRKRKSTKIEMTQQNVVFT